MHDIRTDIRPTIAEVDLAALRENARLIAEAVAPARVLAVLKADAYGHGALACAHALLPSVWGIAVSLVEEGVELRRGRVEAPIVVLGGVYGRAHAEVVEHRLIPVVSEAEDLRRFARAVEERSSPRLGVHLKVDTGMSRLGARPEALPSLLAEVASLPAIEVTGFCTHLAEAEGDGEAPTREQLARFAGALEVVRGAGLSPSLLHVANSAGALRYGDARFDLVRPGYALFGGLPGPRVELGGLSPVLRLSSKIVSLREIPAGAGVSYGAAFRARRTTRIATVPIGYADGYTRRLSGRASVLVGGRRCPVAGNITMDMAMVDVTDLPPDTLALGDEVVLLGAQGGERILVEELAEWSGTIGYEIYCGISKRVPRVYLG